MLFGFIRFVVTLFVIYIIVTIAREILIAIGILEHPKRKKNFSVDDQHQSKPPKEKEVYKDVQDAKFKEIPHKSNDQ